MLSLFEKYLRSRLWAIALISSILGACTSAVVPTDALLEISPKEHTIQIVESINENGQCVFSENNYLDIPLSLSLTTSNGSPIGSESVIVFSDFSENTYSGVPVLSLFDDLNSNGVVDADVELVSGNPSGVFQTQTGKYTGTKLLLLRINLSCAFRGEVRAIAGPTSTSALITVTRSGVEESKNPIQQEN